MQRILIITLMLFSGVLSAQEYWVYFTDKPDAEVKLRRGEVAIGKEAILKRFMRGGHLDSKDVAVHAAYVNRLLHDGYEVVGVSRWLNAVVVKTFADPSFLAKLDFVRKVEAVKKLQGGLAEIPLSTESLDYGSAQQQIELLNGHLLHEAGFTGAGMRIAVLDAGFANAMILEAFDSLYAENRMVDAYDFVHNDTNVYDGGGGHGTSVLSTMAALNSGVMTGVAPHAEYALYTTEDVSSETRQEEYNWVFGSERADSLGCDIINTSLGYYEMDDPNESYTYEDMDGNTTVITRAADIAASRGLIVAASAGNTGFSSWQRIVAPCDGDSVFCVGGTNLNGVYVAFSGRGPSADGRVKPNVVGAAAGVTVLTGSDVPTAGNGTSFSSPVMAGLLACVWQKFPFKNNVEVMQAVELISDQQYAPDSLRGYGLPNFQHIDWALSHVEPQMTMMDAEVFPNPTSGELRVHCAACEEAIEWKLYDLTGKAWSVGRTLSNGAIHIESPAGVYVLQLVSGQQQKFVRLIKE